MGITIDKCLEKLAHERQCFIDECYQNDEELEAYDMAMSTMRKYQKIEQIIDDWENSGEEDDPINIIDNIEEVLEDGNDD